jgi:hypothetical protein
MASKARSGNSYKTQYKAYIGNNTWYKNKKKRLEKRIRINPEDIGAVHALKLLEDGKLKYSRNRKSAGKTCKIDSFNVSMYKAEPVETTGQQLVDMGLLNEQKYSKFIGQGKRRVL